MRVLGMLAALFALLGSASAAQAGAVKLDPSASHGLIAIEIEPGGQMAAANGGYALNMAKFSPEEHASLANSFGGWASLTGVGKKNELRGYYLAKAKPGSYVFMSLAVKGWGVCYNGGTQTFDIKAGEVTFVGRYDPRDSLVELSNAIQHGQLPSMAKTTDVNYLFDTSRLALTPSEQLEPWRPEFEAWLKSEQPGVTAPVVAAKVVSTHFNTGRDAFGLRRICGGYYAKKDKPQGEATAP